MLPALIRKFGQVGLNFSDSCAQQKENGIDIVQNRLNTNEHTREKCHNL